MVVACCLAELNTRIWDLAKRLLWISHQFQYQTSKQLSVTFSWNHSSTAYKRIRTFCFHWNQNQPKDYLFRHSVATIVAVQHTRHPLNFCQLSEICADKQISCWQSRVQLNNETLQRQWRIRISYRGQAAVHILLLLLHSRGQQGP